MVENVSISTRVPPDWKIELTDFAKGRGTNTSKILYDFIVQLLGKTGVDSVDSAQPETASPNLQSLENLIQQALTVLTNRIAQSEGAIIGALTESTDRILSTTSSTQIIVDLLSQVEILQAQLQQQMALNQALLRNQPEEQTSQSLEESAPSDAIALAVESQASSEETEILEGAKPLPVTTAVSEEPVPSVSEPVPQPIGDVAVAAKPISVDTFITDVEPPTPEKIAAEIEEWSGMTYARLDSIIGNRAISVDKRGRLAAWMRRTGFLGIDWVLKASPATP
jgi:hypothetical protein